MTNDNDYNKEYKIVQFLTCGHVDDGKSTLIGRLLYDLKAAPEDHIEAARGSDGSIDFSALTDGLEDERRQGITIDVAYRFFRHGATLFRVADTPGHLEYMRNMAVAAINSDLAVILCDAVHGVRYQTVAYSKIARFFGVKNYLVAINKMDAIDYSEKRFNEIKEEYLKAFDPDGETSVDFIPVSALLGDNIVSGSENTPWYTGKSLIAYLESAERNLFDGQDLRLPVQHMVKDGDVRYYLGTLHGKPLKVGDEIANIDSGQSAVVTAIAHSGAKVEGALPGSAIAVALDRDIDLSRGCLLSESAQPAIIGESFYGDILWLDKKLDAQQAVQGVIKIHHKEVQAQIEVKGEKGPLKECVVCLAGPAAMDAFEANPHTGLFIVIDQYSERTIGVGTISRVLPVSYQGASSI